MQPKNGKRKFRKSVIVAFARLLQAMRTGTDVLILCSKDTHANAAFQEFNDLYSDTPFDPGYARFTDQLAEVFDLEKERQTFPVSMPSPQQLDEAERLLETLMPQRTKS